MKVKIEMEDSLEEAEIIIRCNQLDNTILKLQNYILELHHSNQVLAFQREDTEYYVAIKDIFFFETEGRNLFAHTKDKLFKADYKLYELEELLPPNFIRISKSTIANLDYIYSISRNLTASSMVEFIGSKKTVFVSRGYYKILIEKLNMRRLKL